MDSLRTSYDQHAFVFWIALLLFMALIAIWVFVVHMRTRQLYTQLESIFSGASHENVPQMLADYLGIVRNTATAVGRMKMEHDQIAELVPTVIRRVGLVRFSPFHDTGGDQSFALALLDGRGDGVVITALHSRTDSRLYAKPIERGGSAYALTPEELEAMNRARKGSPVEVNA